MFTWQGSLWGKIWPGRKQRLLNTNQVHLFPAKPRILTFDNPPMIRLFMKWCISNQQPKGCQRENPNQLNRMASLGSRSFHYAAVEQVHSHKCWDQRYAQSQWGCPTEWRYDGGTLLPKGPDTLVKLKGEMIHPGVTFHHILACFSHQMGA